jgi:probable rRNA maturation factor
LSPTAAPPPRAGLYGSDEQDAVDVDLARWLRLTGAVLDDEGVAADAEVSLIFVDEESITDLNRRFLEGTGPTDVLAFPIDHEPAPGGRRPDSGGRGPGSPADADEPPLVLGDVVVCPAVAVRQAPEHGNDADDETALLVVHGLLHLLGHDHAEPADAAAMRAREQELLARHHSGRTPVSPTRSAEA